MHDPIRPAISHLIVPRVAPSDASKAAPFGCGHDALLNVLGGTVPAWMNSATAEAGMRTWRPTRTNQIRRSAINRLGNRAVVPNTAAASSTVSNCSMILPLVISVVGFSASPELDCLVFVSAVQGACGVAARFAPLTLDCRSSDQGIGWSSGEAEIWSPGFQSSRARAAEARARAASPVVSQPMPAYRHDPITSVVSSSSTWS